MWTPPNLSYHETASVHPHTHCRKSAYQALHAAFSHLKPTVFHNISQKVVLCYSGALPCCFEKAELSITGGSKCCTYWKKYTKRGKGTVFIYRKTFVNRGLSGIANHCPNRQWWDLEEKRHGRLEEPLHPTLPVCRIPMKNSNTQAAYQSILSFPHISSTNSKPDRWER